ncbi:MAG: MFS transporter, partial [Candidatus Riflebacteria bacterium]|nr:MFS transporter [Candidatus Riflebacteria bacterium]
LSISLFAFGNVAGRILWGQVHDRIGSRRTILAGNLLFIVSLMPLLIESLSSWSLLVIPVVGMLFGSCFVIYASTIVEIFGHRKFSRLYPFCFLAYGLAALIGPAFGGMIADKTGSFSFGIITGIVILAINLVLFFVGFGRHESSLCPGNNDDNFFAGNRKLIMQTDTGRARQTPN